MKATNEEWADYYKRMLLVKCTFYTYNAAISSVAVHDYITYWIYKRP